jgi:hypothetical protein
MMLSEKIEEVKGAIMISYPMGLPQWDAMRLIVEDSDEGTASVCLTYVYIVALLNIELLWSRIVWEESGEVSTILRSLPHRKKHKWFRN